MNPLFYFIGGLTTIGALLGWWLSDYIWWAALIGGVIGLVIGIAAIFGILSQTDIG